MYNLQILKMHLFHGARERIRMGGARCRVGGVRYRVGGAGYRVGGARYGGYGVSVGLDSTEQQLPPQT